MYDETLDFLGEYAATVTSPNTFDIVIYNYGDYTVFFWVGSTATFIIGDNKFNVVNVQSVPSWTKANDYFIYNETLYIIENVVYRAMQTYYLQFQRIKYNKHCFFSLC